MASLYIRNMVCERCKAAVEGELTKNDIPFKSIQLGEVELEQPLPAAKLEKFRSGIQVLGFELIEDKSAQLVDQIKKNAILWVREDEAKQKTKNFSSYLSDRLNKDYSFLSSLFSSVEVTTIEQYLILQKIERVKELLVYGELSLNQIADTLHYSSVQHLSNQFKKITGLTPGHFKKLGSAKRVGLDKV